MAVWKMDSISVRFRSVSLLAMNVELTTLPLAPQPYCASMFIYSEFIRSFMNATRRVARFWLAELDQSPRNTKTTCGVFMIGPPRYWKLGCAPAPEPMTGPPPSATLRFAGRGLTPFGDRGSRIVVSPRSSVRNVRICVSLTAIEGSCRRVAKGRGTALELRRAPSHAAEQSMSRVGDLVTSTPRTSRPNLIDLAGTPHSESIHTTLKVV